MEGPVYLIFVFLNVQSKCKLLISWIVCVFLCMLKCKTSNIKQNSYFTENVSMLRETFVADQHKKLIREF